MRTAASLCFALIVVAGPALQVAAIDFTAFHTPAQIDSELNGLALAHPTIAQRVSIGTSVQGQSIWALKISDNVAVDETTEGDVVILALHHAREWISAEVALYLAEYLVNHFTDPGLSSCLANLEVWIVPVVNPDGYDHTTTPGARYWRKNRRNNGDGTFGVDLNRNYGYQWGLGGGGSEGTWITSEDTYWGTSAFSEPETAAVRSFIQGLDNPRALLSYHSFSELFLRPWSFSSADPPGETTLAFLAQNSIARIASVHGHTYAESIWYNAFGETTDYFWHQMRLAGFTPELRPGNISLGLAGFSPPPSEIIPTAEENLPAMLALLRDAGCRKVWIKDHAADTGAEPSAVWLGTHWSHPFWTSPDIWTTPATLTEGATVTLHVRVHNDGAALPSSTVRAYWTDPRIVLEFPSLTSTLIGEQTLTLPPGDTVVDFSWTVPTGTNIWGEYHWCVGAIVTHADDRPLTTLIEKTSNIGGKNFQTVPALTSQLLSVAATNLLGVDAELQVLVDPQSLPAGWEVVVPPLPRPPERNRKARILGIDGPVVRPGETVVQPIRLQVPPGTDPTEIHEIHVHGVLIPLVPGERMPVGNGYTYQVRADTAP